MNNPPYPEEQIKTIRQERSKILADLAHLDTAVSYTHLTLPTIA